MSTGSDRRRRRSSLGSFTELLVVVADWGVCAHRDKSSGLFTSVETLGTKDWPSSDDEGDSIAMVLGALATDNVEMVNDEQAGPRGRKRPIQWLVKAAGAGRTALVCMDNIASRHLAGRGHTERQGCHGEVDPVTIQWGEQKEEV
jgi:hypothetical protein